MKSSIFNLLIAGGNSALATLLFNGRNIGIYHALRDSELPGSLSEAAAAAQGVEPWRTLHAGPLLDPPRAGLPIFESTGPFFGKPETWQELRGGWSFLIISAPAPSPGLVSPELGAAGGSAFLQAAPHVLGAPLHHPHSASPGGSRAWRRCPHCPAPSRTSFLPPPSLDFLPSCPPPRLLPAASLDLQ